MTCTPEVITVAAGQIRARLMNEASATLADIEAAIGQAAQRRADLLVLPECAYPAYLLGSAETYGPVPIWLLHEPGQKSQCPGLAMYVNAHFQMLGLGAGEIRYCHALLGGGYSDPTTDPGTQWRPITPGTGGHPDPTTHDDEFGQERLVMIDGHGDANVYETTCYFVGQHYALGVGRGYTTAQEVVTVSFSSVQWQYRTGYEEPYTFHTCTQALWPP